MPASECAASNAQNNWFEANGARGYRRGSTQGTRVQGGKNEDSESEGMALGMKTTMAAVPRVDLPLPPMICDGVAACIATSSCVAF